LLYREEPPQVQQRGLARTAADPLALDQSIGNGVRILITGTPSKQAEA
jgi:hypothetical protein